MSILGLFAIFFARIVDVSCNTVRLLFLVKGQRVIAACIGFFEVMIYMLALGFILGGGKTLSAVQLIFYCGGFATGNLVGSWLEERLLNTFILVEAILDDNEDALVDIDAVRAMGLGATVIHGNGLSGPKLVIRIFCRRHDVRAVQEIFGDQGFVTVSDVKRCTGGWFPKRP
ncbi:MAG: DUF5698 domain-containing protein [Synergistaceae bacterium]|jgi:uncharacterized protein YebE (UPF0316 family)|nr:DUF5698 domain-containing protein [Synergistaceae bacterium]